MLAAPVAALDDVRLLGVWLCVQGACPDEQIEFALEDGTRRYRSWLHDRPSVSDGSWSPEDLQLVIEHDDLTE